MYRKLTVVVFVVFMLGLVSNAAAAEYPGRHMELKVDFGDACKPGTWKGGDWLVWKSWNDAERHDMKLFANIGGSTIDAAISVGHEGDLALGQDLDTPDIEPICNSFMHYYRSPTWYYPEGDPIRPRDPCGAVLLFLTREGGLEPGEYWLYSYHRHPADMNNMQKIEVLCSQDGRWNCSFLKGQYDEYGMDPIDEQWLTGDPNCHLDPCGVIQIHDEDTFDVDIPIEGGSDGDPCHDADLTPSLVKFTTDGAPVLIKYRQPNDRSCGVLNAFILLGPLPMGAWGPVPQNNSEGVCPDANLTWHEGQFVAYEGDANGHDVYFGTDLRDKFVLLDEGFEGGIDANWTPLNWTQYDANDVNDANSHSGRYSATPGSGVGTLTSDALDASDARSLEVELWLHTSEGIEAGEIELYYYDGNNWDFIVDLDSLGPNDVWLHYTDEVTDSQYMVSTFGIELRSNISGGEVFVDDVLVVNTWPVGDQWFIDNRDPCDYDPPGLMDLNTTYYWRIDEVNNANPNSPLRGRTWSFTTEDGKARDPIPGDGAWSVATDANLSWTPSCLATSHDVYFGTDWNDVNNATSSSHPNVDYDNVSDPNYDPGTLQTWTRYYWRVDEKGPITLPKGDVWTFMTIGGVLIHYKFDGVEDANIGDAGDANLVTDSIGNVTFRKVTWRNQQPDHHCLTYGLSNPLINLTGTSAHFHPWSEDVPGGDDIEHRVGLLRDAEGVDILDLAGEAYTIEMWIRQDSFYSWRYPGGDMDIPSVGGDPNYRATLIRKYDRSYVLAIGEDHVVRYGHSGSTITSAPNDSNNPVEIELGKWYHIAAVFDSTNLAEPQKLYINGKQVDGGGTSSLNPLDDDDYVGIGFRKQPTRVGPGLEQNYFDGLIDELRVTDVALHPSEFLMRGGAGQAWYPNPQSYSTDLQCNLESLSWRPGDYVNDVNGHVLYFGTDWDEVNDANSTVHPNVEYVELDVNSYDIPYLLNLDQVYYWRVDQVNDACDPYLWKGTIWLFSVAEYILIDDMEDYTEGFASDYPIAGSSGSYGWESSLSGHSGGSYLGLVSPANPWIVTHGGEQSMVYLFWNGSAFYSEIANHFVIDPCDWTWGDVKMLSLWFYGDPLNTTEVTQQMYVGVEDNTGAGSYTEIRYPLEDMDDLQVEEWQQWPIPLSDFTDVNPSLKLENIEMFYLGFGDRGGSTLGNDGSAYVDSIRLYPRTCVLTERTSEFAERDLNDDCIISFGDVEIMAEDWLEADVNLGTVTQPSDANLVGWWKFDEGIGGDACDSSGNDHNGVIETNDVDVYWVAGRGDVNYALEFDGGMVRVADANELRPTRKLTVCAWIQYFEKQNKGSRIVNKGMNDKETFVLEVDGEDMGEFYVRNANEADTNAYDANSRDRLDRGDWIHLAGTYDNYTVKFYLNGELKETLDDPNAWGMTLSQDTNDLEIGNTLTDPEDDKSFRGLIDDVRLYDRALSAEEIAWLASDGIGIVSVQSIANLINDEDLGERAVNFRDLAALGEDWLVQELFP